MALTFSFSSLRDVFEKLQRDATALNEQVTGDRLFDFVITGYSMIDWVKNDPSVPVAAKAVPLVKALYDDPWLKVCGDLATASKHFKLEKRQPIANSTVSTKGYGSGRYSKGSYGISEEGIKITLNDGTTFNCLELIKGVLSTWSTFITAHGI